MNTEADPTEDNKPKEKPSDTTESVDVPLSEEFQAAAMKLISGCSKQECSFISDQCSQRRDEIYKEESLKDVTTDEYDAVKASD